MSSSQDLLQTYSLSPAMARVLGIPLQPTGQPLPDNMAGAVEEQVIAKMEQNGLPEGVTLEQFVDEATAMALPRAAITAYQTSSQKALYDHDFRVQLGLGVCHMLSGQSEAAKAFFQQAKRILPDEPAPYTNLLQLLLQQGHLAQARQLIEEALAQVPNHMPLWECIRQVLQETSEGNLAEAIQRLAERHDSWLGQMLAAELKDLEPLTRLKICQEFYDQGERDPQFLMEYTARLGMVADYEAIPRVIAAAKSGQGQLPWQLLAHELEAYLAMEDTAAALTALDRMRGRQDLPDAAHQYLNEVASELTHH